MTRWEKSPIVFILILLLALFQGCGKNHSTSATDGATIVITPPSITSTIVDNTTYDLTVTVRYPDGTPFPNATLTITGFFAQPRNASNTTARYQFYYYPNGELNPSNIPVSSGFTAQTDYFGTYNFSITVYGMVGGALNSFSDHIDIVSGTAFGSATIAIN